MAVTVLHELFELQDLAGKHGMRWGQEQSGKWWCRHPESDCLSRHHASEGEALEAILFPQVPVLQCHSRGDRRFSPFGARVSAFGVEASIEDHYQTCKRFEVGGRTRRPADWREAKAWQKAGKRRVRFVLPDGTDLGESNALETDLPIQYYIGLWHKHLKGHPERVRLARGYTRFSDPFEGRFPFSQRRVMETLCQEGLSALYARTADLRALLADPERPRWP